MQAHSRGRRNISSEQRASARTQPPLPRNARNRNPALLARRSIRENRTIPLSGEKHRTRKPFLFIPG
ncbi:MAG TPA: hypothetical protein DDX86_08410 [Akkermansia sp.]|nr:hypothetical protein [Akkermansia sp.]